jgi:N,N'-diacetyllegionaminate synthase
MIEQYKVNISGRWIGDGHPCFIVAEAGANHNRDMDMARRLIEMAAEAEVDAVKFQTYSAETLYSRKTPRFTYLKDVANKDTWQLIKDIELPREWQPELAEYARQQGLLFLSTPFDFQAVDELEALRVPAFKIASFELVDLPLIRHAAAKGKPMILSTGMADYGDILDALRTCQEMGNSQVVLLQCTSLYPTPARLANLRAIEEMRRAFAVPVGLSDHTPGCNVAVAAVALGACLIEKHYTLDRTLPGPDHPFALEPDELQAMVQGIREVESALGDGRKLGPSLEELEMHQKARRSIIAACDISKDTLITREMLTIKRPGFGIAPKFLDIVVGRAARVDIEGDDIITWEMI